MGQVTIYLDDDTLKSMRKAARDAGVSMSSWLACLVKDRTQQQWPVSVSNLAGAWSDFPDPEALRETETPDLPREVL